MGRQVPGRQNLIHRWKSWRAGSDERLAIRQDRIKKVLEDRQRAIASQRHNNRSDT
jgi:hypothetical protein